MQKGDNIPATITFFQLQTKTRSVSMLRNHSIGVVLCLEGGALAAGRQVAGRGDGRLRTSRAAAARK